MGEFFKPWRRKIGVVTLVMACVLMAGWTFTMSGQNILYYVWRFNEKEAVRFGTRDSQLVIDKIHAGLPLFLSGGLNQAIAVWTDPTTQTVNYPAQRVDEIEWPFRMGGFGLGEYSQNDPFEFHFKTFRVPYWSIVIPLTLLSAWLLLLKPRKSTQKKITEPTHVEGT